MLSCTKKRILVDGFPLTTPPSTVRKLGFVGLSPKISPLPWLGTRKNHPANHATYGTIEG